MAGYVIYSRRSVIDAEKNREYARRVGATLSQFGGEVLAMADSTETLEGDLVLPTLIVIRFPDMERVREWYDSPEYAPLKQLRLESTTGDLIIFEST